ncbi:MAG: hypothetical protein JRI45_06840 [Deltaproteobacteria bacterium]|nr:hypothetical protein [Deltaproteobacteria bacterium]
MLAPRYIQRELRLVHPDYFAVFDPHPRVIVLDDPDGVSLKVIDPFGRWLIRKWMRLFPIDRRLDTWKFNSGHILTITRENEIGQDIGYLSLDMRAVHAVKEGLYHARNAKKLLAKIDQHNSDLEEKNEQEDWYLHRYAAKCIWHRYREPTVVLGGK